LQHGLHLRRGFWQDDHQRTFTVSGQAIAFIRRGVFGGEQDRVFGQDLAQGVHHLFLQARTVCA
jgi:6-phosphogluconate dehydrogenase